MTADTLFAGRYRLDRRLGLGGMAVVRLALDTRLERYVAVKLLADHLAQDASFISRFRREALAAARLVHPNVVQVFDFGTDEETARQFIVMEFVDGASCAEILRELGRLAPADAVDILAQACRGLHYAHRHGVVHRDVKPGNLLRAREGGQVKLADFGIAKAAEQSDITKVGSVLGTAAYLSPEQALGEPATPASDLYALGVVSYQLLAGRLPYEAASLTDLARQQDAGPPVALSELDRGIPPALSAVIAQSLARRPEARFADAAAMERALQDGLRGVFPDPTADTLHDEAGETDATRVLERTGPTAPLTRTVPVPATARRRRPLEPLAEAPTPPRAPRTAGVPATAGRRRGAGARTVRALLLLLLLCGLGAGGYLLVERSARPQVELKRPVEGDVGKTVDSLRELIADNTR